MTVNIKNHSHFFLIHVIWDVILFTFVMLWLYPHMTRGIFISDTAYHLYEAEQAFHFFGRPFTMFWLTSYLGGWWLSLNPTDMLYWWSALGGCAVCALSYVFAGHVVRRILPCRLSVLYVCLMVACVFQLHFLYDYAVHYYSLPFLWAELAILLYLKSLDSTRRGVSLLYLALSAFVASWLPALRLPLVVVVALPVLFELAVPLFGKKIVWARAVVYSVTAAVGLVLSYVAFLIWKSRFPELMECSPPVFNHEQGWQLVWRYAKFYYHASLWAGGMMSILYFCCKASARKRKIMAVSLTVLWVAAVIVSAVIAYSGQSINPDVPFRQMIHVQQSLPVFLMFLTVLLYLRHKRQQSGTESGEQMGRLARVLGIVLFVAMYPLGSDCGIKVMYGFPLVAPLCMLEIKRYTQWNRLRFAVFLMSLMTLTISQLPLNADTHATPVNRFACDCEYSLPALRRTYETPERVANHEKLINAIWQYSQPKEEILFLSITYELLVFSERRSWMHSYYHVPAFAESGFDDYYKLKGLPKVAVTDCSEGEATATWEESLLRPYYEKVYSTDGSPCLTGWPTCKDMMFTVWVLKNAEEKGPDKTAEE